MKSGFRQSMAWLHSWAGLLVGWVLFTIFLMGSAAYYRVPLTQWMQPEQQTPVLSRPAVQQADAARRGIAQLQKAAPEAARWLINLPDAADAVGSVAWQNPGKNFESAPLRAASPASAPAPRATEGGDFFFDFHYQLHYLPPVIGRWIVSFCAMCMLTALISGVVTHRRIFVDFFTFRPRKGQRSWLDGHLIAGVLALPYHLMITYTGMVTLMVMLMPWGVMSNYPGNAGQAQFYADAYDFAPPGKRSGDAAALTGVTPLLKIATDRFHAPSASRIWVDMPGDRLATIKITRGSDDRLSMAPQSVTFSGVTGALIASSTPPGPAKETTGVMFGIHEAEFAPPLLRAAYFLSGMSGALMIASGLLMWSIKYRQKHLRTGHTSFGARLVDHLNVATIAGLPIAMIAYFWANRLLPADIANRAQWEIRSFFIVWAVMALYPLCRPLRRAWLEQLSLAAGLAGLLPLLDWLTIGHWVMPTFDIVIFAFAWLPAAAALWYARKPTTPGPRPSAPRRATPSRQSSPQDTLDREHV